MLSDVIAERVERLRRRAGLTRQELAERCKQVGADELTDAALANIETGRRDGSGKRRRRITADELLMLAVALQVPVVWLLADPASGAPVPIVDGLVEVDPWAALMWVIGKQQLEPDKPASGEWSTAHELLDYVYQVASLVEQCRAVMQRRAVDPEGWEYHDTWERTVLSRLAKPLENLVRLHVPLPTIPNEIMKRCAELGINLLG